MATFTEEQSNVINAKGKLIVSASAGSGKTTVMIAKILDIIKNGTPVHNILAVTFTKKAAAQMKEKLRKELIKAINEEGISLEKKSFLKEQLCEVGTAEFSTIHSFCANLLRRHFFEAGIDGGFKIILSDDSAEGKALKNAAIDDLFDEAYEQNEPQFQHLLSCFWRKKKDDTLRELILSVYDKLRERADYEEFLLRSGKYEKETFSRICEQYFTLVKQQIERYRDLLEVEYNYFIGRGPGKSAEKIEKNLAIIQDLLLEKELFKEREKVKFESAEAVTKNGVKKFDDEYISHVEKAKELWGAVKDVWDVKVRALNAEVEENAFLASAKTSAALAEYVLKFDKKYAELKKERSLLDCADLQLFALKVLEKNEDVLREVKERFSYVFVDEYQDVNPLQEELIDKIGGDNLFLVGDMKQSIYAFRGGKAVFFDNKCREYKAEDGADWLTLSKNFRSAKLILKIVNDQFKNLMNKENGSVIDYENDKHVMSGGDFYGEHSGRFKIHFAAVPKETQDGEVVRKLYSVKENEGVGEKEPVSAQVKKLVKVVKEERAKTYYDIESGEEKQVAYGDIAILVRGMKTKEVKSALRELTEAGIPVTTSVKENICDYPEIKTLIDVLSLLDNERQDIPLVSLLLSPIGKMTADELAAIRLAYPIVYQEDGSKKYDFFREAVEEYRASKNDMIASKLNKFFDEFHKLRVLSSVVGAGELLSKILAESRMEEVLLARDNGTDCQRRIEIFLSTAGDMSVHAFLRYLKDVDYEINCTPVGGENAVKLMTIHASKGLEFPVVILFGINARFHGNNEKEVLKVDDEYAIAARYYDFENKTYRSTLLRNLYDLKQNRADVMEELNVYYVALTRAKYALHLIGEKRGCGDSVYGKSFADVTDFSVWEEYIDESELVISGKLERSEPLVSKPDEELVEKVVKALSWNYGYTGLENMPIKSSATALVSKQSKEFDEDEYQAKVLFKDDDGVGQGTKMDAAERIALGLAYHSFLENFDFSLLFDEGGKRIEKDLLKERVKEMLQGENGIEEEYLKLLKADKCVEILSNDVFSRLRGARLYKEQQFLVSLPLKDFGLFYDFAEGITAKATDEEVLFQGAIDLLAVTEDGAQIIDYKYSSMDEGYLREHYAPQLALYKKAVGRILKMDVDKIQCFIVNISLGFEVDMN